MQLVAICGNTGAGKSTLTRLLADFLHWTSLVEDPANNPYFDDFLRTPSVWALHVQLHYLCRHIRDSRVMSDTDGAFVRDRSFWEGRAIYARLLHEEGTISERDWTLYQLMFDSVVHLFPVPDLLIYLRADSRFLEARIRQRQRPGEHAAMLHRIGHLNDLYEEWIGRFSLCPVLTLDAGSIDPLDRPEDLRTVADSVRARLVKR